MFSIPNRIVDNFFRDPLIVAKDLVLDNSSYEERVVHCNNLIVSGDCELRARTVYVEGDLIVGSGSTLSMLPLRLNRFFEYSTADGKVYYPEYELLPPFGHKLKHNIDPSEEAPGIGGLDTIVKSNPYNGGHVVISKIHSARGFYSLNPPLGETPSILDVAFYAEMPHPDHALRWGGNGVSTSSVGGKGGDGIGGGGGAGYGPRWTDFPKQSPKGGNGGEMTIFIVKGSVFNSGTIRSDGEDATDVDEVPPASSTFDSFRGIDGAGGGGGGLLYIICGSTFNNNGLISASGGNGSPGHEKPDAPIVGYFSVGYGGHGGGGGHIEICAPANDFGNLSVDGGIGGSTSQESFNDGNDGLPGSLIVVNTIEEPSCIFGGTSQRTANNKGQYTNIQPSVVDHIKAGYINKYIERYIV